MKGGGRQTGFSLLEAIVAMTLFAVGSVALYALQAQSVRSLQRVAERQAYVAAVDAALPLVEDLNPMREPSGVRRVADLEVRWTSSPLEDPRPGRTAVGSESLFEIGLYEVDVDVRRDGQPSARFKLRRVGYRQVRQVEEP